MILKMNNLKKIKIKTQSIIKTKYRIEILTAQDKFARADVVGTSGSFITKDHACPLIDGQGFVGVHEPRKVLEPFNVHRYRRNVQEEPTEQLHQRQ